MSWTKQDHQNALNKAHEGKALTDHEVFKLKEAVKVGNRATESQSALDKANRK